MVDGIGQEAPVEETNSQETQTPEPEQQQSEGGIHPAWEPIRQQLGLQFETIKPELAKIDKNYHDHIEKVNGQLAPWKPILEQGVTPQQVQQAFMMLQKINESPEEIYQALGQFLQENGRLPQNAAEAAQAVEDADEAADEYDSEESRKISELEKQLNDLRDLQAQQLNQIQMEQIQAKADREVEEEYSAFQKAHPDLSPEDWREIQMRHYQYALQGPEHVKPLEEVGKEYFDLVERIRSAPRPNDLAPRLPGAGGAAPAPKSKDPSEFSREESVDALADLLARAKQNQ